MRGRTIKNSIKKSEGFSLTVLQKRLLSVSLAIAFIFCAVMCRFFWVQAIDGSRLVIRAADQWNREVPVIAARGKIYDRDGTVLAGNLNTYSVFARPAAVEDKPYCAKALAAVLNADADALLAKISRSGVSEVTVATHVNKECIDRLVSLGLPGVYYARDNTRTYSYGELLCQVLGFTSTDGTGISGLEKYYDGLLSGKDGEILYATDIVGIERGGAIVYTPAEPGSGIKLTIDASIQIAAEDAVRSAYRSSGARSVSCIVLDPRNFEVLALANYPSYDLNDVPRDDAEALNALSRNTVVADIYEPGSTFKVITAAANLEEYLRGNSSAFSPQYIFNSSRTRSVDGTRIKCWSDHKNGKHSNQTLALALNNSCNPCFTDIALSLGKQKFYEYLTAFGLGAVTGIDFSGEAAGMLLPQSLVRDCDLARIGFGQTVALTRLQLACAVAAAVNGGNYYQPRLVSGIVSPDGSAEEFSPVLKQRVISAEASAMLAEMLEGVVRDGSGKNAYIAGYKVGGKTGTAQKYEDGKIAVGKYVSSFVGFFPADDPQYLALVTVDEPQGAYYGSVVAAPVAKELFSDIIAIKNIAPYEAVR